MRDRRIRLTGLLVLLAACFGPILLAACSSAVRSSTRTEDLNILLVSWDTVRADHLGLYGSPRSVTPNLDRLARRGATFWAAYSQAPWTLPSHVSVFTGLYASSHGVDDDGERTPEEIPFITELLLEDGYQTMGVSCSGYVGASYGFKRGFEDFVFIPNSVERGTERVTETALTWLDKYAEMEERKPFFMFLHFLDAHTPYDPPGALARLYDPDYRGSISGHPKALMPYFSPIRSMAPADLAHVKALYDGEIHRIDAGFGQVLARISGLGELDRTLIVLFSDHGEEFKEHGSLDHGYTLYEEAIRVPLLVVCPALFDSHGLLPEVVELTDIMPTILSAVGLPVPRDCQGRDLMPLLKPGLFARLFPAAPREAFSETTRHGRELRAVRTTLYKYIKTQKPRPQEMIFHLENDPGEQARQDPEAVPAALREKLSANLGGRLAAALESRAETVPSEMTLEEVEHLKSIGYTFAGMQTRAQGSLNGPRGLAVGPDGRIYVADHGNHQVKILHPDGQIAGWIGSGDPSRYAEDGQFLDPMDVCVDGDGRLYVSDPSSGSIQIFDPSGLFVTRIRSEGERKFSQPTGLAVDDQGFLYAISSGSEVVVFDRELKLVRRFKAGGPRGQPFARACDLAIDREGRLLVAEFGQRRIQVLDRESGEILETWAVSAWDPRARQLEPALTAARDGRVLITDPPRGRVMALNGERVLQSVRPGRPDCQPAGLVESFDGTVYVSLYRQAEVKLIDPAELSFSGAKKAAEEAPPGPAAGAAGVSTGNRADNSSNEHEAGRE